MYLIEGKHSKNNYMYINYNQLYNVSCTMYQYIIMYMHIYYNVTLIASIGYGC